MASAKRRLIAALCGPAPAGYARWSLRLLADQAVELDITAEPVSHETVRKTLKANRLKPWLKKEWCIPPNTTASSSVIWKTSWRSTVAPWIPSGLCCAWTSCRIN